jgi:hypothetical protein
MDNILFPLMIIRLNHLDGKRNILPQERIDRKESKIKLETAVLKYKSI